MVGYDTLCRFPKYGGGGIRTHGALADTLVFKTRALNHSTTPPNGVFSFEHFYSIAKGSEAPVLLYLKLANFEQIIA